MSHMDGLTLLPHSHQRSSANTRPTTASIETFAEIHGSLSVAVACLVGMGIAMYFEYCHKANQLTLDSSLVVTTILMLMEVSTTEKFYFMTVLRMLGTLVGGSMGMAIAILENIIEGYYKPVHERGLHKLGMYEFDWILIVYRCLVLTPCVFICAWYTQRFPRFATVFLLTAMQCVCAVLSPTLRDSAAVAASSLLALVISILCMITFRKQDSESYMTSMHKKSFSNLMLILQLAVTRSTCQFSKDQFYSLAQSIGEALHASNATNDDYSTWRTWIGQQPTQNYSKLNAPLRMLFYETYCFYSSLLVSVSSQSVYLFCDDYRTYQEIFAAQVKSLTVCIDKIKSGVLDIFSESAQGETDIRNNAIDEIIQRDIRYCLVGTIKQLKQTSSANATKCYASVTQRQNADEFFHKLLLITVSIIEYMKTVVTIFDSDGLKEAHISILEEVLDEVNKSKNNRHSFNRQQVPPEIAVSNSPREFNKPCSRSSPMPSIVETTANISDINFNPHASY